MDVIRERDFRGFVLKISLGAIATFCDTVVLSERNINNEMCIGRLPCAFGHYHKFAQNMRACACACACVRVRVCVRACVCAIFNDTWLWATTIQKRYLIEWPRLVVAWVKNEFQNILITETVKYTGSKLCNGSRSLTVKKTNRRQLLQRLSRPVMVRVRLHLCVRVCMRFSTTLDWDTTIQKKYAIDWRHLVVLWVKCVSKSTDHLDCWTHWFKTVQRI